jgi:hypothetical protein
MASRTQSTWNSVGMRSRYSRIRSKFESDAQWVSAEATAYCVAAFSGTGFVRGFTRIGSMGRQFAKHSEKARELRRRAGADRARKQLVFEPRISALLRMRDTNSQDPW